MLFRRLATHAAARRALTLGLTALVALVLKRALAAYADSGHWAKATPEEWITTAALSFIGAGIIRPRRRRAPLALRREHQGELMRPVQHIDTGQA
jgi:hypothetical protein